MIEAKAHTPFYCKHLAFTVGKEKDFNKVNKKDIVEVKGLYMDKSTGIIYFILDDDAYVETISFIETKREE